MGGGGGILTLSGERGEGNPNFQLLAFKRVFFLGGGEGGN